MFAIETNHQAALECPVCGSCRARLLYTKGHDGRGLIDLRLYRCSLCNTAFQGSFPEGFVEELYDYYADRLEKRPEEIYSPINSAHARNLLERIRTQAPGNRLLDVGCGQGELVKAAIDSGWQALGIDMSYPAVALCRMFGIPAQREDFFSDKIRGGWDVISMCELIEHVPSPGRFIARAEELLTRGGLLYLTTPNFSSIERRLAGAHWNVIHREHLTYFTPYSLRRLIRTKSSLEIISMEYRNFSPGMMAYDIGERLGIRRKRKPGISAHSRFDEHVREKMENLPVLKIAKGVLNSLLSVARLGSTAKVLCRK